MMSLFIASLNSGSNGNCYYIGTHDEAILVDAGISCRETEKRMKRLGLSMEKIKAIFISHEHSDHIAGIAVLAKKYHLPVYITLGTRQTIHSLTSDHTVIPFSAYNKVQVGSFTVTAFPKFHDARDPHSFIVTAHAVTVGVFTDIGSACDHVVKHFRLCHAAFLESNYDADMLANGSYPIHLKNRIRGGMGHLSNDQALQLFKKHRPSFMRLLLLSHLSRNNNNPGLVYDLFQPHAAQTKIVVASRDEETAIYPVTNTPLRPEPLKSKTHAQSHLQLSLF